MPEISRFLGIVIYMYYKDHNPAHFHAIYGEYEIIVYIDTGVVEGKFPKRALGHVIEWYEEYKDLLMEDWKLLESCKPLNKIPGLE